MNSETAILVLAVCSLAQGVLAFFALRRVRQLQKELADAELVNKTLCRLYKASTQALYSTRPGDGSDVLDAEIVE